MKSTTKVPGYLEAVLFGSGSIIIGLIWDICWHRTIGRDTFWSPPHMAIYVGGLVAGLASAAVVLRTTFRGDGDRAQDDVTVLGFRGPLGAFFCCWGAGAMLTSAPFDDWWHNAYGLDVTILSPPHMVLALGIMVIQVGAMVTAVAHQNRAEAAGEAQPATRRALRASYVISAGLLFTSGAVFIYEKTIRVMMHHSSFYQAAALVFPFLLVAAASASRLRWPATWTALVYTGILLGQLWLLPMFPAEPRLGPVRHAVDHFVPLQFPLLVLIPAIGLDLVLRRANGRRAWGVAAAAGGVFLALLLATQWPFANFLMSPASRNALFATHEFPYFVGADSYFMRRLIPDASRMALLGGLTVALGVAVVSSRLGLLFGGWMSRVQR
jgi:hypothetical protein